MRMRRLFYFATASLIACCWMSYLPRVEADPPNLVDRVVVHQEAGYFLGWPANNGVWDWEDGEMMVGFTRGNFVIQPGHKISPPHESWLARSLDGGHSWQAFEPQGFVVDAEMELTDLRQPLDFMDKNFALRIVGAPYHGSKVQPGGFFYSNDRGKTWDGPISLKGLSQSEELKDLIISARTEYIIESQSSALLFLSAADTLKTDRRDRAFVARTTDGGMSFEFQGWIIDPSDPSNGWMPDAVKTISGKLLAACRRRDFKHTLIETEPNPYMWVDVFSSVDNGVTWKFLSRGGETGGRNGNPPDLIQLNDGRLCLTYGNRGKNPRIISRFSFDQGETWGPEIILREGTDGDFGYPQVIQKKDGKIVTIYYLAESSQSEKYIEATIWDPGKDFGKPIYLNDLRK